VINLKTAKALGLTFPLTVLARGRRGDRMSAVTSALQGISLTFGGVVALSDIEYESTYPDHTEHYGDRRDVPARN
jgi:hypothetical protein